MTGLDNRDTFKLQSSSGTAWIKREMLPKTFFRLKLIFMHIILFMPHKIMASQITYDTNSFVLGQNFWFVYEIYFYHIDFDFLVVQNGDIFQILHKHADVVMVTDISVGYVNIK